MTKSTMLCTNEEEERQERVVHDQATMAAEAALVASSLKLIATQPSLPVDSAPATADAYALLAVNGTASDFEAVSSAAIVGEPASAPAEPTAAAVAPAVRAHAIAQAFARLSPTGLLKLRRLYKLRVLLTKVPAEAQGVLRSAAPAAPAVSKLSAQGKGTTRRLLRLQLVQLVKALVVAEETKLGNWAAEELGSWAPEVRPEVRRKEKEEEEARCKDSRRKEALPDKKAQAEARATEALLEKRAQLAQHVVHGAMMRACADVRAERERERLQTKHDLIARLKQEALDAEHSQMVPGVEVEPMSKAEEAVASAFHAVLGGDVAQGKELRAASAGTLYRGARSTSFKKQAKQHQNPSTIACGEQRETFKECAGDGLVTTKGCPFNMSTWVPLPYGSEALFQQIYFVPVEVDIPPQFTAQPTAFVRIAKGDPILETCEPFFNAIRAHGDKLGMKAPELERIVSYCAAQCLVACATLHTPSRPDHLPRKVLAVEAYGGEGDAAEGKRHLDAKKTAAYQRMPAGQVYFQAYQGGTRWGLSIRLGGPGQLLLRALAPEDERVPLHKAPYEGLDSTALRSATLLGMRHLLTTKIWREFHVHSDVLNITSDKRLRLVLSPPAQCHPTAAPAALVMSAQRLNSDMTQTSAASPLLPDGTERGRTPPPQPLMQPPTLMQLPLPSLPPSAAVAPPVPEAPRVLSANALGKRKIGSW